METIILAGGLGTRLQSTIGDFPKCMASVAQKPFLHYIFEYLENQGCSRIILSLGYKHEVITRWVNAKEKSFKIDYVIEEYPLGTGGGIRLALEKSKEENLIVLNGDTFFNIDLKGLLSFHVQKNAETTLALKQMEDFERYGSVHTDVENRILSFEEKKHKRKGLINGGIYVIRKADFLSRSLPEKFSFEKDYLENFVTEKRFFGKTFSGYFIDIGIPEDFQKAQKDFSLE